MEYCKLFVHDNETVKKEKMNSETGSFQSSLMEPYCKRLI